MTMQDLVRQAFGPDAEQYIFDVLKNEYKFEGRPRWDKDRLILWLVDYRSPQGVQQTLDRLLDNTQVRVRFATNVKTATFRKLALAFEVPEAPAAVVNPVELTTITVPLSMLAYYAPRTGIQDGAIFAARGAQGQTADYVIVSTKGDQVVVRPLTGQPGLYDWRVVHLEVLEQLQAAYPQFAFSDARSVFTVDDDETERLLASDRDKDGHWWGVFESETTDGSLHLAVKRVPPLLYWRRIEQHTEPFLTVDRFSYDSRTAEVHGRSAANSPWLRMILGDNDRIIGEAPPLTIEDGVLYWRLYRQALVFARAWQGAASS